MERVLNCYNYIFSTCQASSKCPYGHVIVTNKEEYFKKYELNIDGTRDRTSPKGNLLINLWSSPNRKKKRFKAMDDNCICFLSCSKCHTSNCENRSLAISLKNKGELYLCKNCLPLKREFNGHNGINCNEGDTGGSNGFFDRLGMINM